MIERRPSRRIWLLLALAPLAVAGFVWAVRSGREGDHSKSEIVASEADLPRTISREQFERLDRLMRRAVAHLENGEPEAAEKLWDELERELPRDRLVAQNRLVSRALAAESERSAESFQRAMDAGKACVELDPSSPIPAWIEGRLLTLGLAEDGDSAERAASAFARAAQLAEANPGPWFEWRLAAKLTSDETSQAEGRAAIAEAYRLAPDNLFVALEQLAAAAEAQSPEFVVVARRLKDTLEPLQAGILRRTKTDVRAILEEAIEFAEKQRWPQVELAARRVGIVRSEDIAQSDRRRVQPHPLEFLRHEFSTIASAEASISAAAETSLEFAPESVLELPSSDLRDLRDVRWADLDLDGEPDLLVLSRDTLVAYLRRGDRWRRGPELALPAEMTRMALADLDRDDKDAPSNAAAGPDDGTSARSKAAARFYLADCDAVLYGPGGILVVRNSYDSQSNERSWLVVNQAPELPSATATLAVALADVDHDGDLDLVSGGDFGIRVWTNRGNMLFDDASSAYALPTGLRITGLAAVDWDRDIDMDILAVGPASEDRGWLENLRHLQFRWNAWTPEFAGARTSSSPSLEIADFDGDASWDLARIDGERLDVNWSRTAVPGQTQWTRSEQVQDAAGARCLAADFDNDGYQDLLCWGPDQLRWARGGGGSFGPALAVPQNDSGSSPIVACDASDFDHDGDLDLVVARSNRISWRRNDGGNSLPWLDVRVRGADEEKSGRVNHYAIGSVVELRHGNRYQAQLVSRPGQHFGLGKQPDADLLRVTFTNGIPQSVIRPQPKQTVLEPQRLIGSCPYLYTWNGDRFEFVTDLLWAAPLGLQVAEGQLMPDRPWEYLKIEGERLQARDGRYHLRITEELWEAAYFDQVELIAVDHPADVEIFTNEKVGPPEVAQPRIHTVRKRRPVRSARDQTGRDWTSELATRDDIYAQPFDRPLSQGIAPLHFLELDLGPFGDSQRVTLYLTGWIYPTDPSLNIGRDQNPERAAPVPPRLLAWNESGEWEVIQAFMGFPGGKTKTIAMEIPVKAVGTSGRLRIETSAELRWDEVFFATDEPDTAVQQTPLALRSALLRYRGFSQPLPRTAGGPERYDYDACDTSAAWPTMAGRFTRYGDVRELITSWDDHMAVFGAGDELALEFEALPAPPAGWKRDFVLHNVGWDKDGALNTVYGQTVEPLPFRAMPAYPYPAELAPSSPQWHDYLRRFQTREQPPRRFGKVITPITP